MTYSSAGTNLLSQNVGNQLPAYAAQRLIQGDTKKREFLKCVVAAMYSWQHCGTGSLSYRQPRHLVIIDQWNGQQRAFAVKYVLVLLGFQKFPFFCVTLYKREPSSTPRRKPELSQELPHFKVGYLTYFETIIVSPPPFCPEM